MKGFVELKTQEGNKLLIPSKNIIITEIVSTGQVTVLVGKVACKIAEPFEDIKKKIKKSLTQEKEKNTPKKEEL